MSEEKPQRKPMQKAKLNGADLRKEDLTNADLSKAKLADADLSGMVLDGLLLESADLKQAKLDGAKLTHCILRDAQVKGEWQNVTVEDGDFSRLNARKWLCKDSTFRNVSFAKANLRNVVFQNCTFENCTFVESIAPDINLLDCTFVSAQFVGADFSCPVIKNSNFSAGNFNLIDLSGSSMSAVTFDGCNLDKADLIAGEFENLTLKNTSLKKANFRYARGLDEAMNALIREQGGKASRGLIRRASKAMLGNWTGRIATLVAVLILAAAVVYHQINPENWSFEKLINSASQARDKGDYKDAFRYLDILKRNYCDDEMRCLNIKSDIARTLARNNQYDEALKIFGEVAESDLLDQMRRFDLKVETVRILVEAKRYPEAIDLTAQLFTQPEVLQQIDGVLGNLFTISMTDQYNDQMQKMLADVVKLYPQPEIKGQVSLLQATLMEKAKDYQRAIALLKEIEETPEMPESTARRAMMNMAGIYTQIGQTNLARDVYQRIRERFPSAANDILFSKLNEAQLLQSNDQLEEAEKILREILANPEEGLPYHAASLSLASILVRQRRFDEADKLLADTLHYLRETDVQYAEALALSAQSLANQDKHKEAIKMLDKVIDGPFDDGYKNRARRQAAASYASLGDMKKAMELMKQTIAVKQEDEQKANDLAQFADLQKRADDTQGALETLEEALTLTKNDNFRISLIHRICDILKQAKIYDKAVERLQTIIDDPATDSQEKIWAYIEMVDMQRQQGNLDKANALLEKMNELPMKAGDVPPNFLSVSWAGDPEGQKLVEEFLEKIIKIEPSSSFAGANARLAISSRVNNLLEQNITDEEKKKKTDRAETLCREVIAHNQDLNLIFQAYEMLAMIRRVNQDADAVRDLYREFEKTYGGNDKRVKALALLGAASSLIGLNQQEEGIKLYQQALEACAEPMDCCRIATELAQHQTFANRKDEAKKTYQYILDKIPSDCWGREEAKRFMAGE